MWCAGKVKLKLTSPPLWSYWKCLDHSSLFFICNCAEIPSLKIESTCKWGEVRWPVTGLCCLKQRRKCNYLICWTNTRIQNEHFSRASLCRGKNYCTKSDVRYYIQGNIWNHSGINRVCRMNSNTRNLSLRKIRRCLFNNAALLLSNRSHTNEA